mgnify:CR=1 FL=1
MFKNISQIVYVKKHGAAKVGLVPTQVNKLYVKRYKAAKKEAKEWMKPFKELSA